MKHIFTVIGVAAFLIVALTVTNVGAQSSQPGVNPTAQATSTLQIQTTPTGASPSGWNMGMRGGMKYGHMGMRGA